MKRLLMMLVAAFAVIFGAQTAFAQHNEAQKPQSGGKRAITTNQGEQRQHAIGYPRGPGQNPKEYPASILANAQPFMPKDTMVGVGWMVGKKCDQDGSFTEQGSARCKIFVSHSAGKVYVYRPSQQEGDRYFVWNGGSNELYVHFTGGSDIYRIAHQSPAAEQFASANGYKLNQRDRTMVATNGAAPAAAPAVVAAVPAPQGSPAADCTKGTYFEVQICKRLGGAGTAAVGAVKP